MAVEFAMAASRGPISDCYLFRNNERGSYSNSRQPAMDSSLYARTHMQYYAGAFKVYSGKKNKLENQKLKDLFAVRDSSLTDKRRTKLPELVSRDVSVLPSTFSQGKDEDKSLAEDSTLQALMRQLDHVKLDRKQRKKETKAQKKAQKKLQKNSDMAQLHMSGIPVPEPEPEAPQMVGVEAEAVFPDGIPAILVGNPPNMAGLHGELAEREASLGCRQVQVCMGGKCKKLGSEQLLAAFEESIQNSGMGSAIEAVGCKCMGKCRSAPNVKVQNDICKELHMGVGMGDVDLVLDRHFGLKPLENDLKSKDLVSV